MNRNYGFHFNEGGSSDDECDYQLYHGKSGFSEPESRNVRDFILKNKEHIKYFQSLHSYGQTVILPWGYTEEHPDNYDKMLEFANKVL